ncbi:hypothetical protein XA68_12557 [Ophiocordyceps unilateralis]|uniref:Uncharacterized protein n=1 Tax=Ophiocordyceps unilateralis TaxID=268505 RepID=A0A2A9PPE7_OPHUN|nr:hypothetical protein XA68_12557 [Ophiocordyceps unilateralis]
MYTPRNGPRPPAQHHMAAAQQHHMATRVQTCTVPRPIRPPLSPVLDSRAKTHDFVGNTSLGLPVNLVFLAVVALAASPVRLRSEPLLNGLRALFDSNQALMRQFCHQNSAIASQGAWNLSLLTNKVLEGHLFRLCPSSTAQNDRQNNLAHACDCVAQGPMCASEDCRVAIQARLGGPKAMAEFCFAGTHGAPTPEQRKPHAFALSLLMSDGGPACFSYGDVRSACRCSLPEDRQWQFPDCRHDVCYASLDMLLGETTGSFCRDMLTGRARAVDRFGIEGYGTGRECDFTGQLKACRCTQPEPRLIGVDEDDERPCRLKKCYRTLKEALGRHVRDFCKMVLDTETSWAARSDLMEFYEPNAAEVDDVDSTTASVAVEGPLLSTTHPAEPQSTDMAEPSTTIQVRHGPAVPAIVKDAWDLGCEREELLEACRCAQPLRCADDGCYEATKASLQRIRPEASLRRRGVRGRRRRWTGDNGQIST